MPYIQTNDGVSIYYYDWGSGKPVVLIHGWPLTSASWEHQARVLADNGYRVIAYDRRGFGRSEWSYEGYEYNTLAADLNSLMEKLNLTDATLVGFSFALPVCECGVVILCWSWANCAIKTGLLIN